MKYWPILLLLISLPFGYLVELATLILVLLITNRLKYLLDFPYEKIIYPIALFVLIEVVIIFSLGYDLMELVKQIVLLSVFLLLYNTFAKKYFRYPRRFCKVYLDFALIMAIYSLVGYLLGHTYGGRAVAWAGEAGDLALLLLPAICFYIYKRKLDYKLLIIGASFILASSTASFAALLICIAIRFLIGKGNVIVRVASLSMVIILLCSIILFLFNEQTQSAITKFEETTSALTLGKNQIEKAEQSNFSTYALLVNLTVAQEAPYRLCGTGMGTHRNSYERIYPESKSSTKILYGLNKDDAYSLAIRVFSEFGWIGLIAFFAILIKWFNYNNVYNYMAFGYLMNATITGGHYSIHGLILFFFLYYYTRNDKKALLLKLLNRNMFIENETK